MASSPAATEQAPAIQLPSDTTEADPLLLADSALQGRRLFEAEAYLDRLAADPRSEALLLRAELALLSGDPREALILLDRVTADADLACRAGAAKAMALLQFARAEEAKAGLDMLGDRCSSDAFYWRSQGRIAYAKGDIATAVAAFRAALALHPSDPGMANDLAVTLIAAGDADQASSLLGVLLRRSPRATEVSLNLDFANAMRGMAPERRPQEDDDMWSTRLQFAGQGARQAHRQKLAESLLAQALLIRPRYDLGLWQQYSEVAGRND